MSRQESRGQGISRSDISLVAIAVLLLTIVVGMFTGVCDGPTGEAGPQGEKGASGPQGSVGDTTTARGPQGEPGGVGDKGARGDVGEPGPAGAAGEPGPAGVDASLQGAPGTQGDPGPQGAPGEAGPVGPPGSRGEQGTIGYIHPPPMSSRNPRLFYQLLFAPDGVTVVDAARDGIALAVTRRRLDLRDQQAVRAQYAHDLNGGGIRLGVEFWGGEAGWVPLIPAFGSAVEPFINQTSLWYAVPQYVTGLADVIIRARVYGDGELDPAFIFIALDAR